MDTDIQTERRVSWSIILDEIFVGCFILELEQSSIYSGAKNNSDKPRFMY